MMATLFKGTAVLGADLWNEPKEITTWGSGNITTDWHLVDFIPFDKISFLLRWYLQAAQRVGNAILSVNPDWLIFIEGIGTNTWWGGNLHGVEKHQVKLDIPNKVLTPSL